jgi:transposase
MDFGKLSTINRRNDHDLYWHGYSQEDHHFLRFDSDGKVVHRGTVSSVEAGWLEIVNHWSGQELAIALETGTMTWWVVDVLREAGVEPVVIDARQFKMISDSKKKSDRHDARALADGIRCGLAQRIAVNVPRKKAAAPGL